MNRVLIHLNTSVTFMPFIIHRYGFVCNLVQSITKLIYLLGVNGLLCERPSQTNMIATHQITYSYPSGKYLSFPDLECVKGQTLLITGQSGCGKTTLLHLLGGLITPATGSILINNHNIGKLSAAKRDVYRGKNIGIIFQKMHFIASLSVAQNLQMPAWLSNTTVPAQRCNELLDELGIADQARKLPAQLSSGQLQRLAIARAFYHNPSLILADEPTASLDDSNTENVIKLLQDAAHKHQTTLVVVTHDQRLKNYFTHQIELK